MTHEQNLFSSHVSTPSPLTGSFKFLVLVDIYCPDSWVFQWIAQGVRREVN